MTIVLLILIPLAVLFFAVIFVAGMYNRLVAQRQQVDNAWSQIDVQLKRRHDLIPNLVETVKGYAKHERETFETITRARAGAMQAAAGGSVPERVQAENQLSQAVRGFMIQVEAYPELKANQTFLELQKELTSTEDRISFTRQTYNNAVTEYNTTRQVFPTNLVAGTFGFAPRELWQITDAAEREAPQVTF